MPITSKDVKILSSWTEGHLTGKLRRSRRCEITGGSGGSAADPLPASAFLLTKLTSASPMVYGNNAMVFITAINNDESGVLVVSDDSVSTLTPTSVTFNPSAKGTLTVSGV